MQVYSYGMSKLFFLTQAVLEVITNASNTQQQQPPEPLTIGNSSELQIGEPAIAIGYPFIGEQSFSNLLKSGVISEIGIEVRGFEKGEPPILNAIITDAATAGGNSGGPLLNIQGQVIGMTTGGDEDASCCTYAIPSNTITHIVPVLVEKEEYIHPYIGLEPTTLSAGLLAESFEDLPNTLKGVVVTEIDRGGPADKAGINGSITDQFGDPSSGDIITAIDGEPITTADEFNAYIDEHKSVGEKVMLTIYRNGQILNSPVTLEKTPSYSSNNSSSSTTTTSDILTYQNSSYGIEIQYLANWTKDEGDFDLSDGITDIVEFSLHLKVG
jgi:S1-C subfamily serine protease